MPLLRNHEERQQSTRQLNHSGCAAREREREKRRVKKSTRYARQEMRGDVWRERLFLKQRVTYHEEITPISARTDESMPAIRRYASSLSLSSVEQTP